MVLSHSPSDACRYRAGSYVRLMRRELMFGGLVIGASSGKSSFSYALSTPAYESLVFWALLALEGLSRLAFLGQCSLVVFAFAFLHSMAVGAALSRVAPFVLSNALGCGAPCHSPG